MSSSNNFVSSSFPGVNKWKYKTSCLPRITFVSSSFLGVNKWKYKTSCLLRITFRFVNPWLRQMKSSFFFLGTRLCFSFLLLSFISHLPFTWEGSNQFQVFSTLFSLELPAFDLFWVLFKTCEFLDRHAVRDHCWAWAATSRLFILRWSCFFLFPHSSLYLIPPDIRWPHIAYLQPSGYSCRSFDCWRVTHPSFPPWVVLVAMLIL